MTEYSPVVNIQQGCLRGKRYFSANGKPCFSFQGIPYAKPPVGSLRFKAPEAADYWPGVRDADTEGSMCAQIDFLTKGMVGSEDCLYINVYTPEIPKGDCQLKPVMVWIHGGAFMMGSSHEILYSPAYLMNEDIVFVSFNYRLGAFGFLYLEDDEVLGNCGLRDQVCALEWIKKNISLFGGDDQNITIFGESAGGASVQFHILSQMSKNLFHKAISQSGSVICEWAITTNPRANAFRLGQLLGCKTKDSKDLVHFLKKAKTEDVVAAQQDFYNKGGGIHIVIPFGPVIELASTASPFLNRQPYDIITEIKFNHVPHMTGMTSAEGTLALFGTGLKLQLAPNFLTNLNKGVGRMVPYRLRSVAKQNSLLGRKIKEFYFGKEDISEETKPQYLKYATDVWFAYDINNAVKLFAKHSRQPVYSYMFSFDGCLGFFELLFPDIYKGIRGPGHAEELGYLFKMFNLPEVEENSPEAKTRGIMIKMWTNFAKYGNPTPNHSKPMDTIWQPANKTKQNYLQIDYKCQMQENITPERFAFWDELFSNKKKNSKL